MVNREELRDALRAIIENPKAVYFQPPETIKLSYPCIIYELNDYNLIKADNGNHMVRESYSITLITKLPDETFSKKILNLPMCRFNRVFVNDGLYHYVFTIYL